MDFGQIPPTSRYDLGRRESPETATYARNGRFRMSRYQKYPGLLPNSHWAPRTSRLKSLANGGKSGKSGNPRRGYEQNAEILFFTVQILASGASNAKMPPSMQKSKNTKKRDFTHHSLAGDFNLWRFTLDESTTRSVSKKHCNLISLSRPFLKGPSERITSVRVVGQT